MKLYIIGNGFDMAHNLKTTYWDFRCYLEQYAGEFLVEFEKLYGVYPFDPDDYQISKDKQALIVQQRNEALFNTLWKSFELSLGNPSELEFETTCDTSIAEMGGFESGPVGIEDSLDNYFEEQFGFVSDLQRYLSDWAKQIKLKNVIIKKDILKNSTDLFLTFNYTATLERIYGISKSHICHIHGGISPYCDIPPVIGHGNTKAILYWDHLKKENDEVFDEGGASKCTAISNFYKRTLKDTNGMLLINRDFFQRMVGLEEIVVIGHSLGEVDLPYFESVVEISGKDTPWTMLYYSVEEKEDMESRVRGFGVENITMMPRDAFWDR